jgi:hypothetical protein
VDVGAFGHLKIYDLRCRFAIENGVVKRREIEHRIDVERKKIAARKIYCNGVRTSLMYCVWPSR